MSAQQGLTRYIHWIFAGFVILWNARGGLNFFMQVASPEFVAGLPQEYIDAIARRPDWATAGFGLAVFGGLIGGILLLFRVRISFSILLLASFGALLTVIDFMDAGPISQLMLNLAATLYAFRITSR